MMRRFIPHIIIPERELVWYFEPIRHKVTFENSFSKTAIKISFSFHNYHSVHIIIHLGVKAEFCIPIFLRQLGETTTERTSLTTAPFALS